ncbi:50S ribosomal protein L23 [Patescibacteria group bacterium]|nr:50S ribosomal protein L23 [Patescibacteria group bacterium]
MIIIKRPVVTEKAITAQSNGKYTFIVTAKANRNQVAASFEELFGIKPLKVNMLVCKGKVKTNWKTRSPIYKPNLKKAIVTIEKGQIIDLLTLKNEK